MMNGCEDCELRKNGRCPVLNMTECPVNQLWKRANEVIVEAKATIADVERFIAAANKLAK